MASISRARSYTTTIGENRSDNLSLDKIEDIIMKKTSSDQKIAVDRLQSIDVLELIQILKILKKEHGFIELENAVFENFLSKVDPQALSFVNAAMDMQSDRPQYKRIQFEENSSTPRTAPMGGRSQSALSIRSNKSRSNSEAKGQGIGAVKLAKEWKLNFSSKNEFTEKLITELSKDYEDRKRKGIKELRELYSNIEELKYRCNDIEGTIRGFKQNVVEIAYDAKNGILPTEKFLKYFINWLKNASAMVSTMRLRIHTLRDSCRSIRTSILKKKDLIGIISAVDFEALRLKKNDYIRTLEDRNDHLLKIKQINAKASIALVRDKKILNEIELKWKRICERIKDGKNQITKIDADTSAVEKEIKVVRNDIVDLAKKIEEYSAPSIEEYIEMKAKVTQLEKMKNGALRKNQLLKLELKNKKQSIKIK